MKLYIYHLAAVALTAFVVSSCKNADINDEHHYDNKVYINSAPVTDNLLIKEDIINESRTIAYRLAAPVEKDIQISFGAVPSLTAAYNLSYADDATALPEEYYEISEKHVTIKAGAISGDDIVVNFKNLNRLDENRRYVLPVSITDAGIGVLESARTTYFIIKGAALINVVANIRENYLPVKWKDDNAMRNVKVITVEALVRSNDWEAERTNAISTIFGVEGNFLLRIGDADRPRNQLQVVAPGGSPFPPANYVSGLGLPVNEWVHIAVVYNSETKKRIYYKNGVKVYEDSDTGGAVNLVRGNSYPNGPCYIGRSFDNDRWLPGDISEVRVWNIERTEKQIAQNPYKIDPASEGLIAYWKFNEGEGKVVKDYSASGQDITAAKDLVWVSVELPEEN